MRRNSETKSAETWQRNTNEFVIDANIIFAALIKNSRTRDLFFDDKIKLFAPEFIFEEMEKYSEEICRKAEVSENDLKIVLNILMRRVILVPKKEIMNYMDYAREISPDQKDVPYLALALKLKICLWSNDKKLKNNQGAVRVYSTKEIIEIIGKYYCERS